MSDELDLLKTNDAVVWAKEFMRVLGNGAEVDEGLMISWFANAFYAQEVKSRHVTPLQEAERAFIEAFRRYYTAPYTHNDSMRLDAAWNHLQQIEGESNG